MFQRLVLSVFAIQLLCSIVSCGYIPINNASCELNGGPKLDRCKEALLRNNYTSVFDDRLITGQKLNGYLSYLCTKLPILLGCVYNVREECPSDHATRLLYNIERIRSICDGNAPVNWLRYEFLAMGDVNKTCVQPHLIQIFRTCGEMLRANAPHDDSTEIEIITFYFRCMRTQLPTVTALQTDCGVTARQVLLIHVVVAAESLVLPSDEELDMLRLGAESLVLPSHEELDMLRLG